MKDWRDIRNGNVIPSNHYCDQPYVVITDDGGWLCCITTGSGVEGCRHAEDAIRPRVYFLLSQY